MSIRLAALSLLSAGWALLGHTAEQIADIRQGTNLAPALAPSGETLVVGLAGQLWKLPSAGGGAEPLTPAGEEARNPRYSPDGRRIVYQRLIDGQWDLWLLDLYDSSRTPVTATPHNEREPDFTADGRAVVFASDQTGHYCLWTLQLDTGTLTQLTEEPGDASFPTVSELEQIAYVSERSGEWSLRVLTARGVSMSAHASRRPLAAPSWRPGGGVLVFSEQDSAQSSRLQMLLLTDPAVLKPLTGAEDVFRARPAWVSSAELIYAADGQIWRRGIASAARRPVHLFAALAVEAHAPPTGLGPLDGPGPFNVRGIHGVTRSFDGARTVFTALGDLWLTGRGDPTRLTDDPYVDIDPVITPDGESVIFASDRGGQLSLWRATLVDRPPTQLTFGTAKAYRPAISPEGRRVAFLETDGLGPWSPARLRVLDLSRGAEPVTLADGLLDAATPVWDASGRTVTVSARTTGPGPPATEDDEGLGVNVEIKALGGPPAAPTPGGAAAAPPGSDRVDLAVSAPLQWTAAEPPRSAYVVEVGRLFDGIRGDYRRHVDIHVADGRIAAIVGRGVRPASAMVIDARDATVIPGLIDVHAHHSALAGERLGRAWLAFGVTTVREIAEDLPAALERAESWASGRRVGPRLVITPDSTATEPLPAEASPIPIEPYPGVADGLGHSIARQALELATPALRPTWRQLAPFDRSSATPHYELELSPLGWAYQDSFSRVITSLTVTPPALGAVLGFRDPSGFEAVAAAARDTAYQAIFDPGERASWEAAGVVAEAAPALQQTIARLVRGGGRVAVGTDAPAVPYGLGVHLELALLVAAGIPPDQALRLATAEGALALGLETQLGTLEEGKLADFVVIDGDPLARIADSRSIRAVVRGGTWLERPALLAGP